MTANTVAPVSIVDSLMGAYRSHVLGRALPMPAMVHFTPSSGEIAIQPGGALDLRSRLSGVLVWAYTLADVTAQWWHTPAGALHVTVNGRTTSGARITVYAAGPFVECLGLVTLARDEREGVSLDELYALVGLLGDARHEREVA